MTVTVQRIVDLTEHYGTSGAFIARLCGKSRSLIAGWKDGKATPTDADLSIIADLYGVSVAYLRGEVDAPASNVKNAMQQQLMDSVQGLTDDEMRKVIERSLPEISGCRTKGRPPIREPAHAEGCVTAPSAARCTQAPAGSVQGVNP